MKEERIRLEDFRFREEIIIPGLPEDVSAVAHELGRAAARELEALTVDAFTRQGALWVPRDQGEPSRFTEDEVIWRHDSRNATTTASTSGEQMFEAITRAMEAIERNDPLRDYRGQCELKFTEWVEGTFVIDRDSSGIRDLWADDERPPRWWIITGSPTLIEDVRRMLEETEAAIATVPPMLYQRFNDEDVLATIAYSAHENAQRLRRYNERAALGPLTNTKPVINTDAS